MSILALNAGSTSLKFRIEGDDGEAIFTGEAQGFSSASPTLEINDSGGARVLQATPQTQHKAAEAVLAFVKSHTTLRAIGHRFVHGGTALLEHSRIDNNVRKALESACSFAPLHNPPALAVLSVTEDLFPELPQVACLDTAFHAHMPEAAKRLPLPSDHLSGGLRRYGFHGLSCESILRQLDPIPGRLVIAHLGGGASITAVQGGRSMDNTMGLTPDGGVMMETRSGDLDPGLILYLLRAGESVQSLELLLNTKSGIAGVSGAGGDVRNVRAVGTEAGLLALEMFGLGVAKAVAGMAVVLGGLDSLIFTGGIGWHDTVMRASIQEKLSWMPPFEGRALRAREEELIIDHTRNLI